MDGKTVRYAIDTKEFSNFSWRGFVIFSPIQDKIIFDIDLPKSSVYKLLFHYKNPTHFPIDVEVMFQSIYNSQQTSGKKKRKIYNLLTIKKNYLF